MSQKGEERGFWLHASNDAVLLEGYDAGVSFRTVHDPRARVTVTVFSNTRDGAWPIARYLENAFQLSDFPRRSPREQWVGSDGRLHERALA
jgi:hypothetical protein